MKNCKFFPLALLLLLNFSGLTSAFAQKLSSQKLISAPPFSISTEVQSVTCNGGNDGYIRITSISGGVPPYTHKWNTGSSDTAIYGLTSATYSDTIRDSRLPTPNKVIQIFFIDQPDLLQINFAKSYSACTGGVRTIDGLTAVVTGGTPSYKYNWNRGDTTAFINALTPNNYVVTVTDANNCTQTASFFLNGDSLDLIAPQLFIPVDMSINCNQSYTPLSQFGNANGFDGCGTPTIKVDSVFQLNSCASGAILRIFTAIDSSGNITKDTQRITVNYIQIFGQDSITFPPDYDVYTCTDSTKLRVDSLAAPFNKPVVKKTACANLFMTSIDLVIGNYPACYKILRKWTVMDMCQPGATRYEHEQIISVNDTTAPVITCPASITLNSAYPQTFVNLNNATATDCSKFINFSNNYNAGKANASGNYPWGITNVTITANDSCKNSSSCSFIVQIKDVSRPVAVCREGITINLSAMPGGILAMAPAYFFNNNSYDNNTPKDQLKFQVRRVDDPNPPTDTITFTCEDHAAPASVVELELWVEDTDGNKSYCIQRTQVQDNNKLCAITTIPTVTVSGTITNNNGEQIQDVMIYPMYSDLKTLTTGMNGVFTFPVIPLGTNVLFKPSKNTDVNNGVSTLDLILIRKHILGVEFLSSPFQYIASDINKDQKISTADLVELRKVILLQQPNFNTNESWRFVKSTYQFTNLENPLKEQFPEGFQYNGISKSDLKLDFKGVKIGDVDDSAKPNDLVGASDRNYNGNLVFEVADQWLKPGQTYRIPFLSRQFKNIAGFQQTIKFDQERLTVNDVQQGILPGFGAAQNNMEQLSNGYLLQSWDYDQNLTIEDGFPLFTIEVTATEECLLSKVLYISTEHIRAEAYQYLDKYEINTLQSKIDWIQENKERTSQSMFELYQNKPNPFTGETVIGFQLPIDGQVTLQLFDATGKMIFQKETQSRTGYNEITITADILKQAGVYTYQLITAQATASKKMLFLK